MMASYMEKGFGNVQSPGVNVREVSLPAIGAYRHNRHAGYLLVAVIILGAVLRVRQYLALDGLWSDEAMLAVNLRDKSWTEVLFGKLDAFTSTQAAAPGFLAGIKAVIELGGVSEYWLRLLPLLASVAALILFAILARRLHGSWWSVPAVALVALTRTAIQEAANLKQYSLDMAVATILLLVLLRNAGGTPRWWLAVSATAAVAVWFSHPVVIVYCGAAAGLCVYGLAGRRCWSAIPSLAAASLPVLLSFPSMYFVSVRGQRDEFLADFWVDGFAPWGGGPMAVLAWCLESAREIFSLVGMNVGLVLFLWGLMVVPALVVRYRWASAVLLGVILMAIGFGAAHLYPVNNGRLGAYLIPVLAVGLVMGTKATVEMLARLPRLRQAMMLLAAAVFGLVVITVASRAVNQFLEPRDRGDSRALVAHLRRHLQPGHPVYVLRVGNDASLRWYWPELAKSQQFQPMPPSISPDATEFWIVTRTSSLDGLSWPGLDLPSAQIDKSISFVGEHDVALFISR